MRSGGPTFPNQSVGARSGSCDANPAYEYLLTKVVVAEIITTVRDIPQEVPLGRREGLGRPSVANLDNIHVIPLDRVGELVGVLPSARHTEVKRAVGYALDWPELKVL